MSASTMDWQLPDDKTAGRQQATIDTDCLHCGSRLGRFWQPEDGPFCCRGCRTVYELIHGADLEKFYDLRRGPQPPASSLRPDSFAWLDRVIADQIPTATASAADGETQPGAKPKTSGLWRLSLDLQGVHCAACVWLLEELYHREAGGISIRINPTLGKVGLVWDPQQGALKDYLAAVEKFGYRFGPSRKKERPGAHSLLMRMAVSIAVAVNVMMFSISYYLGLAPADGALYTFFGWLSLLLATLSVIVGGQPFFRGAVAGLRRRVAHLDLPISFGMVLAYSGSVYAFFRSGPETAYFDTLTVFIALMLVGRWAQQHVLERNRNALLTTSGAENLSTRRLGEDGLIAVPVTRVERGDELWIAPGDIVPVDGVLLRKNTTVSLDWITGESDPVDLGPGEIVPAGAFNADAGGFAVTATESFAESRLQTLLRAPATRTHEFRPVWWHRVSTIYVVAVLTIAAVGFLLWAGRDLTVALQVAIAILVVTCPCALGLATPLAEELVHHTLRQHGVLVRTANFLEKALQVHKILLDKTGTLTLGELALAPESAAAFGGLSATDLAVLTDMTARSNHPVSRCLNAALSGGIAIDRSSTTGAIDGPAADPVAASARPVGAPENLIEQPGAGLSWECGDHIYRLGKPAFARGAPANRDAAPTTVAGDARADTADIATLFTIDGHTLALFYCRENLKADAAGELAALRESGYTLHLLSGDAPAKVRAVAQRLGIEPANARGGLDPEAKAAHVRALDARDTLMVGDGLNDSPSFEAALCAATPAVDRPVLPGKADFYFLGDGIAAIGRALGAARQLRRIVRDNLAFAVVYNVGAVALCLAGLVTPLIAAVLMPLSSITVVGLTAYRLSGRRRAWIS